MFYILKKEGEKPRYYRNQRHIQRAQGLTELEYHQMTYYIRQSGIWESEGLTVERVHFEKA